MIEPIRCYLCSVSVSFAPSMDKTLFYYRKTELLPRSLRYLPKKKKKKKKPVNGASRGVDCLLRYAYLISDSVQTWHAQFVQRLTEPRTTVNPPIKWLICSVLYLNRVTRILRCRRRSQFVTIFRAFRVPCYNLFHTGHTP